MRKTLGKRIAWILMLCVALWGQIDSLPLFASLRPSAPVRFAVHADHSPDCRCAQCPGGRRCCCRPAPNAAQAYLLKARCDTPSPTTFTAKINPPLPSRLTAIPLFWMPAVSPRIFAADYAWRSFAPAPPTNPPQFT